VSDTSVATTLGNGESRTDRVCTQVVSWWKNPDTGNIVQATDGCSASYFKKMGWVKPTSSEIREYLSRNASREDSSGNGNGSDEKSGTNQVANVGLLAAVAGAAYYFYR